MNTFESALEQKVDELLSMKFDSMAKQLEERLSASVLNALKNSDESEYMTRKQAEAYLHIAPSTLYNYVKAGVIKQYKLNGETMRTYFKRSEIEALLLNEN